MPYTEKVGVISIRRESNKFTIVLLLEFDEEPDLSMPITPARIWKEGQSWENGFELHRLVNKNGNEFSFESYSLDQVPPENGEKYVFCESWTPGQLETAQSDEREWHAEQFRSSDATVIDYEDSSFWTKKCEGDAEQRGKVVSKGWDHEHCYLCQKTICDQDDEHFKWGYVNKDDEWICPECFEKYIRSGLAKRMK